MVKDETSRGIRCRQCGALLAAVEDGDIVIRRGGLQARFAWGLRASIVCYRCKRLNVISVAIEANHRPTSAS